MKKINILIVFLFLISFLGAQDINYSAGYDDGCLSAKGNFTKSTFSYDNIPEYKKGWLDGNRECKAISSPSKAKKSTKRKKRYYSKKRHHYKSKRRAKRGYYHCKGNPWINFSKGWSDGYRSAQGRWRKLSNSCPEYYRGWYEGYNHCKCQSLGECVEVSAVY
jgi:hypothetical protein